MKFGLSADYFTSQAIYERESERIFNQSWLCAGRGDALAGPREIATATIESANVILVHDGNGMRAYHNACRHRGAQLVTESRAPLTRGCITCPYHAWSYDATGALVSAPNMQHTPGWDATGFGLIAAGCLDWCGYVMIHLGDREATLPAEFHQFSRQQSAWNMERLQVVRSLQYEVRANWKLLFQNYSECYHCPTVHPALSRLTPFKSASNDQLGGAIQGGPMCLDDDIQTMSMDGISVAPVLAGLADEQRRLVYYYTIFPTMFVSNHPDYVMVHRLSRKAVDCTEVTCEFLFDHDMSGQSDPDRAVEFWDMTNRQDWHVCERVQRGAASPGYRPGPYSSYESVLPKFDAYYLAQLAMPAAVPA